MVEVQAEAEASGEVGSHLQIKPGNPNAPALSFPLQQVELSPARLIPVIHLHRTQAQSGSASIKKVLPVLVPELSYTELEIGDGMFASNEYVRVTFGDVSNEERIRVRAALLKYCHLDTLAMIRII